jgi:hypothetical protein
MLILTMLNASTLFFCVGHEDKPLFLLQIFSPPCGLNMLLSLKGPKFPSDAPSDDHPTTPKHIHQHLKLKTQKSKLLLRISVTTTIPTTCKCTQIAPKQVCKELVWELVITFPLVF